MRRIATRQEYCMGCRLCEIHCLVRHSRSKQIIKAYKGEYPKPLPRVHVEERGHVSFALQCRHCEDAPCLDACITGAMRRDRSAGTVICDEERCVGCWMCIMACPVGVISRDIKGKKIASKCDLCAGEETPVCVSKCPNEALKLEDTGSDPESER